MVPSDCVTPDPETSRPSRRSPHLVFLNSVSWSVAIAKPPALNLVSGQRPARPEIVPENSTDGLEGGGAGDG